MKTRISLILCALAVLVASPSYAYLSPSPVDLGTAGDFVILAQTGITTTGTTSIVGDIGISPGAASLITGFGLVLDGTGTFSTSSLVTGRVYAANYTEPTPTNMTAAIGDKGTAYTDANSRPHDSLELGGGTISGQNLAPGVYEWTSTVTITSDLTLTGGASDVWIFQIAQTLGIDSGMKVILAGGAQASNIFWAVAGQTTLGTDSEFKGTILDYTGIAIQTGATLDGRALAGSAVTLDANTITPEPCTILLLGSGLVGLLASRRRSHSAA